MKNERLENAKDTVAVKWGFKSWDSITYRTEITDCMIDEVATTYADSQLTQMLEKIENKQYEYIDILRKEVVSIHDIRNIFAEYGIKLEPKF